MAKSLDALRREVEKRDKDEEGLPEVSIRFERMLEDWKEKWIVSPFSFLFSGAVLGRGLMSLGPGSR